MTDAPVPPSPPTPPTSPTPPAATAAPTPAAAPPVAPKPANPGSATTLIWRRPDRATLVGALTTVIVAWVIELARQVLILAQSLAYSLDDGPSYAFEAFGDFFFYGLWRPLFFFGLVFLALWQLLPIVKESTLGVVLKRAAVSGVAGLVGMLVFGLVVAIANVIQYGFFFGYFGADLFWQPLITAFNLTITVLVGATIAWLRANRPPKAPVAPVAPVAPAAPAA